MNHVKEIFTVNKQNFRYWAAENPWLLHLRPLHSPRVTVSNAVAEFSVRGPYFFEEDKLTGTVTSDRDCHMIETFLRPKLNKFLGDHEEAEVWECLIIPPERVVSWKSSLFARGHRLPTKVT
ncbi:uncharacterized protein TNCV_2090131 [Trichonephila clavipes]|nr:uncharacterized protein TNCV_2090131 [Trichonephila clavipes]